MEVLPIDVLCHEKVTANPPDRCYHCKQQIFGKILEKAKADGFSLVLDGTNASDDAADRPGMRALAELKVRSPLRECGLTKAVIREKSMEAGLFTWDKPAYACLATRIPTGEVITAEKLERRNGRKASCSPWACGISGCGCWGRTPDCRSGKRISRCCCKTGKPSSRN